MALYFNGAEHKDTSPLYFNGTGVDIVSCNGTCVWRFAKSCYVTFGVVVSNAINSPYYGANLVVSNLGSSKTPIYHYAYQVSGDTETGKGTYLPCLDCYNYDFFKGHTATFNGKYLTYEGLSVSSCDDSIYYTASLRRRKVFNMIIAPYLIAGSDQSITKSSRISKTEATFKIYNISSRYTHRITWLTKNEDVSSCGDETTLSSGTCSAFYNVYRQAYGSAGGCAAVEKTGTATESASWGDEFSIPLLATPSSIYKSDITASDILGIYQTYLRWTVTATVYFTDGSTETISINNSHIVPSVQYINSSALKPATVSQINQYDKYLA